MESLKRSAESSEALEANDLQADAPYAPELESKRRKTIGLEKTMCEKSVALNVQRVVDIKQLQDEACADCLARLKKLHGEGPDLVLSGGALEQKQDLEKILNASRLFLEKKLSIEWLELTETIANVKEFSAIRNIMVTSADLFKECKDQVDVSECRGLLAKMKRSLAVAEKKQSKDAKVAEVEKGNVSAPPIDRYTAIGAVAQALIEAKPTGINMSSSMYEAKIGIHAAQLGVKLDAKGSNAIDELKKNHYVKMTVKTSAQHCIKSGTSHCVGLFSDVAKKKKVDKLLRSGWDSHCFTTCTLPDEPWADRIFGAELYHTENGHYNVHTTNNCMVEARIYLSGSEIAIGIPFHDCPGDTFAEKRHHARQLPVDGLLALVSKGGFAVDMKTEDNKLFMFPSGFIIIWVSRGAACIRWGVWSDDNDKNRVLAMADESINCFPEFRNQSLPMSQLVAYLRDQ